MNYLVAAYGIIVFIIFGYFIGISLKYSRIIKEANALDYGETPTYLLNSSSKRLGLIGLSSLFILLALYMALVWSPDAKGEPASYRIIYFHVSSAIMAYVGFFITFVGSILYLWKRDLRYDRWAKVGADLGVHFCTLMMLSGMIWGKQRWGAWWIWEPRLTMALALLIIYVGYLVLRHVMENPETTARYAAVYGIIGFIDVPIVHYAIKLWGKIMHPVVTGGGENSGLAPEMMLTLKVSMLAFFATFVAMYFMRLRLDCLEANINQRRISHDKR